MRLFKIYCLIIGERLYHYLNTNFAWFKGERIPGLNPIEEKLLKMVLQYFIMTCRCVWKMW